MNQDPVFEFSEHFDGTLLHTLFENDLNSILEILSEAEQHLTGLLAGLYRQLEAENWEGAGFHVHNLANSLSIIGQLKLSANARLLGKKLSKEELNKPEILIFYHQLNLSIHSFFPIICSEIKRMRIYLDTHYPKTTWIF